MITGSKVIDYHNATEKGFELLQGKNKTLGLLIVCGANMGLRISDLRRVTFEQLKSGAFILNEKKTKKKRRIKVNAVVREALEYFKDDARYQLGGYAFVSNKGSIYSPQAINRFLKRIFGAGYSTHGLRKGFGRRVFEKSGENLAHVQLVLQHKDPSDTLRYIGITQEQIDNTYDELV